MSKAGKLYLAGEEKRKEFCLEAERVVGLRNGDTQLLADEVKRSVDRIEDFAEVGRFMKALIKGWPTRGEVLVSDLQYGFLESSVRLWKSINLETAKEWLENALETGMDLDYYRRELSEFLRENAPEVEEIRKAKRHAEKMRSVCYGKVDKMTTVSEKRGLWKKAAQAYDFVVDILEDLQA